MIQPLLLALVAALAGPRGLPMDDQKAKASGGALAAEQACFDVQHVTLELTVDPEARTLEGTMSMNARGLAESSTLFLDLDFPLAVRRVQMRGDEVQWKRNDGRIEIPCSPPLAPGQDFGLVVEYGGTPRTAVRAPWDGGFTWAETADGSHWIATTCQGEGADLWWPCKDHPSDKPETFDLFIKIPTGLICASNGVLLGTDEDDGWTTFHWHVSNPIANYNIALNIAPYVVLEDRFQSSGGELVPVLFYALPESVEQARALLPEIREHLTFFEQLLGPYPFRNEKYGVVETPHLGMEHQTIIAYGYGFKQDPTYHYDWLHHHELSHEWWGNLVTCDDWKDMWIHEGFGTYCQALWVEQTHGREGYVRQIRDHMHRATNQSPVAPRVATDSKAIYFGTSGVSSNDIYYKGSAILHTLRWLLGDEVFFESLRQMCYPDEAARKALDGSQVRFVDTDDYIALVERLSGQELDWFFDVYLRQPELPLLDVKQSGTKLAFRWEVPGATAFPLPIPLVVNGELQRVACPKGKGTLTLPEGATFELDPEIWLFRAP